MKNNASDVLEPSEIEELKTYWELPNERLAELQAKVAWGMMARFGGNERNVAKHAPIVQIISSELAGRNSIKIAEESKQIARDSKWIALAALGVSALSLLISTCS